MTHNHNGQDGQSERSAQYEPGRDEQERFSKQYRSPLRQPLPQEDDAHNPFPVWLAAQVPDLATTRCVEDPIARCKFFTPDSFWTWYVLEAGRTEDLEGNPDVLLYGYVEGLEHEFGYFSLSELAAVRGPMGLPVERDVYFAPCALSQVMRRRL